MKGGNKNKKRRRNFIIKLLEVINKYLVFRKVFFNIVKRVFFPLLLFFPICIYILLILIKTKRNVKPLAHILHILYQKIYSPYKYSENEKKKKKGKKNGTD